LLFSYKPILRLIVVAGAFAEVFGLLPFCLADTLDQVRQRGTLRWGGDQEGGGPYIFEGKDGQPTGFEVELADYLAGKLGVRAEFVQKTWDNLPQELVDRQDIDCIINGYEWFPNREQKMASTIPYYAYKIQLFARKDDDSIRSWDDLRRKPGQPRKKVGVLSASGAHRYLEKNYGEDVEIRDLSEEGTTGVMLQVQDGTLDATVQDLPAGVHYVGPGRDFPSLKFVGPGIELGYYVIFVRKEDQRLREELNKALREAMEDGTLKRIYQRYGMWDADQEKLADVAADWPPPTTGPESDWMRYGLTLARAAVVTLVLSFTSMPLAIAAGLLIALGRLFGSRWLAAPLAVYVEVIRGTPLLLQLFVIYYLLPYIGVRLEAYQAGILALAINYSAYEAEIYRAGLLAIPHGQMEAALALGMSKAAALRRIIVPQAVRLVVPPVTNDFIALFKDTAICSVIAVTLFSQRELTGQYRYFAINHPQQIVEFALMTAALYLLMSYPLSLLARRLEKRVPRMAV
jgi:polar amino acid transport system substrate-binding protein